MKRVVVPALLGCFCILLSAGCARGLNGVAEETVRENRKQVEQITGRAENILRRSTNQREVYDGMMDLMKKYSLNWQQKNKEPEMKLWEHVDRQLAAIGGGGSLALVADGKVYDDTDQLENIPSNIRKAAVLYLSAFNSVFDMYVFVTQYYEGGEKADEAILKVKPDAGVAYEVKDGQLYFRGKAYTGKQIEEEFLKAARYFLGEGDRALKKNPEKTPESSTPRPAPGSSQ